MSPSDQPRRSTPSLRFRFVAAILVWVTLGIGGIWYSATRLFERHVEQLYHEELEVHVRELVRLTRIGRDGQPELSRPLSDPRYEVPLSGFYWQVTAPGKRMLKSESLTRGTLDEEVAHSPAIVHKVEQGPTGPAITYGLIRPGPDGAPIHFLISTDQAELDRLIDAFTRELTVWLGGLAALLLLTGMVVIHFTLRPLNALGQAISRLRRGESERLEGRYPSEIAPLVADLNEYVGQNAEMVSRSRVQAGNLAHSLRTPLAVIMDEAERLSEGADPRDSSRTLLDQAQMMEQQIDYQLARARSAAGAKLAGSTSRLPELLVPILAAMRRLHPGVAFELSDPGRDGTVLPVDPVDLSELLSILLDNAGKWAASRVTTALRSSSDGALEIVIQDDGPGMTEDQIAGAFQIGKRFDPEKAGSGLGLAIAQDLAREMGAQIALRAVTSGLRASVRFREQVFQS